MDAPVDDKLPQRMLMVERNPNKTSFMIKNDTVVKANSEEQNPDHLPQNMFIVVRNTKST